MKRTLTTNTSHFELTAPRINVIFLKYYSLTADVDSLALLKYDRGGSMNGDKRMTNITDSYWYWSIN